MCNINEHTQTIHFGNQFPAKRAHTIPSFFFCCTTVTHFVISCMRECDIAYPHTVEKA